MSIRSNALPVGRDLAPELQEILRKNGMQAHIIRQGEGYQLAVQGHDSPLLTYAITAQQHRALVDWGANSANKQAYNTVAELVKNDFYMPRDFVHARNANGRVAMGLHGYRIGVGEYGRLPWNKRHVHMMMDPYHGRFLGWTPRCQEGFHMRRVGGAMFMQGAAARYACCPEPSAESEPSDSLTEADWRRFQRAVSHITISQDAEVTLIFTDKKATGKDE